MTHFPLASSVASDRTQNASRISNDVLELRETRYWIEHIGRAHDGRRAGGSDASNAS